MPEVEDSPKAIDPRHQRRLAWAVRMAGAALMTALERDTSEQAVRLRETAAEDLALALGQMIMQQADPTANKRFTPWVVREYAAGRLILEDLGSANDTLTLFQRYASRLKTEQRDIQRYKNLAAAWEVVREFAERDEAQSNRAQKALDRAQAYAESRILRQDQDGFTVAVPLTEFAAKWWGKGTRWCTAAENNNQFWRYHKHAPLFVMLIPGHGKFQLWFSAKECQFMDAGDQPVSAELSREIWPWVGRLLLAALEKNGYVLKFIPEEQRIYERCLAAVQQLGIALHFVPEEQRTQAVCLAAVLQNGWALQWVPRAHQTHDLCLIAVNQAGSALEVVPQEFRTYDLCLTAVQRNGWGLKWVPEERRTYALCLAAVQENGNVLKLVPEDHRTRDLYLAAVREDGWALEWVPQEHRTQDLCLAAVKQDGNVLKLVPEDHRTRDLYLAAVQQNGEALANVPQEHRSYDLCLAAVQKDGTALYWVPEEYRTYDFCLAAVQQTGGALVSVPEEHRTYDLCLTAVQQNGMALKWVPRKHRTGGLCLAAVKRDSSAIQFVPAHQRAEPLAKLPKNPPTPEPAVSWDLALLTPLSETLNTASQMSIVQHA